MHNIYKGQFGISLPSMKFDGITPNSGNPLNTQLNINVPSIDSQITGNFKTTNALNKYSNLIGGASDLIGSFLPTKKEYYGPKSGVTVGLDSLYDSATNAAMSINPVVGSVMKLGKVLDKGINSITGGTDGMTTQDAILGSTLGNLTGVGIINSALGKRAATITKDNKAFEQVGSSYSGSNAYVDSALSKSNKKYGLFSNKARHSANRQISEAKRQQNLIAGIADDTYRQSNLATTMSDVNSRRYKFINQGGFQNTVSVGQKGLKFPSQEQIEKAKRIAKSSKPSFEKWVVTVPKDRLSDNYDLKRAYEVLPFQMLEDWRTSSVEDLESGKNHLRSIYELPDGDYEFLKLGTEETNPEVHFETDTYYSGENGLKETHDLIFDKDSNRYFYRKKTQKFKDGGKMNVVPEGALHARLNHMDVDHITKKGIPVITKENGGDIVQHAEIERNEIIFTKEVTKQLEDLYKDGSEEAAIKAGKLLAIEIIENTQDNTGLLKEII